MPLLSVVITVFNTEEFLRVCLNSIILQIYKDYEVLIIDDGSTDGCGEICDEYARMDDRFKVVHQENKGIVTARKTGVLMAKGKYVCFVDSDDWIDPNMFEVMVSQAEKYGCDIVSCDAYWEYPEGNKTHSQSFKDGLYFENDMKEYIYPVMMYNKSNKSFGLNPVVWNKLFRRDLLSQHIVRVDPNIRIGEDVALCFPVFLYSKRYSYIKRPLYHYRINLASLTKQYDESFSQRAELLFGFLKHEFSVFPNYGLDEQLACYRAYLMAEWIKLICRCDHIPLGKRIRDLRFGIKNHEKIWKDVRVVKYSHLEFDIWPWIFLCCHHMSILCFPMEFAARVLRAIKG